MVRLIKETIEDFMLAGDSTSPEELEKLFLAYQRDSGVLAAIANNVNTPESILIRLSKNRNSNVRAGVASNKSTPKQVLLNLAYGDRDEFVRDYARRIYRRRYPDDN